MDGQLAFPELDAPAQAPAPASVIRFTPRAPGSRRREAGRLDGSGLAARLRHDVERMVSHRRRMLSHLMTQSQR